MNRIFVGAARIVIAILSLACLALTAAFWQSAWQAYTDPILPPMDRMDWWSVVALAWAGVLIGWVGVLGLIAAIAGDGDAR